MISFVGWKGDIDEDDVERKCGAGVDVRLNYTFKNVTEWWGFLFFFLMNASKCGKAQRSQAGFKLQIAGL